MADPVQQQQQEEDTISSSGSSTIPNWRLIPSEADDYKSYLIGRSTWSEQQYKDSLDLYEEFVKCSVRP